MPGPAAASAPERRVGWRRARESPPRRSRLPAASRTTAGPGWTCRLRPRPPPPGRRRAGRDGQRSADLLAGVRGRQTFGHRDLRGVFLAVEGGDGAGKSTQVRLLSDWLLAAGYDVVVTREPGATPLGARVRSLLLDPASGGMSPRAEAPVSYTHLRAHETPEHLVCRLLLEKKKT